MTAVRKALVAFGRFWLDFLIGDTPEIFVGTLVIVAGAFALRHHRSVGLVVIIVLAVGVLVASTMRGRVKRRQGTDNPG